ncbi:MAG: hypothetical protein KDH88_12665 [Chromatiales bacterium]|nr:hypothetical protein [Chromatiales bacterium]
MYKGMVRRSSRAAGLLLFVWILLFNTAYSTERYSYDPLGQLRVISRDDGGPSLQFTYDSFGNLLSVKAVADTRGPGFLSLEPGSIRAGEALTFTLTGSNLAEATVSASSEELLISEVLAAAEHLQFRLTVLPETESGQRTLLLRNPNGETPFSLEILPALPQIQVAPLPLVLPEDSVWRQFLLRFSNADVVDREIRLAISDDRIAEVGSSQVSLAAGSVEKAVAIRGINGGVAQLTLESDGLASQVYSVYVSADFGGENQAYSDRIGVSVGNTAPMDGQITSQQNASLGVAVGNYIESVAPANLTVGSIDLALTVRGNGLAGVTGLTIEPADGIDVANLQAAADGRSVDATVSVQGDTGFGPRRVVLQGSAQPYLPLANGSDRINIAPPLPIIHSIEPNFGLRGSGPMDLLLRGEHFEQADSVRLLPSTGVSVGTQVETVSEGEILRARIDIAGDAPLGARTVTVVSPNGASSSTPTAANTFLVTDGVQGNVDSLVSPLLGVTLGPNTDDGEADETRLLSPALNVVLGPMARLLAPGHGEQGTSLRLTVQGAGLDAVNTVEFDPSSGIAVDGFETGIAGDELFLNITLAIDAPQTTRRLRLFGDSGEIPFTSGTGSQFLITGPLPEIDALSPNTLRIGSGWQTITLYGRNLEQVTGVSATPAVGLSIDTPVLSEDATRLAIPMRAETDAVPGPRTVILSAPVGNSSSDPAPANTIVLYEQALLTPTPFVSPLLGIRLGEAVAGEFSVSPLVAPLLGVNVGNDADTRNDTTNLNAYALGIVTGPVIRHAEIPDMLPDAEYLLRFEGRDLTGVDSALIVPGGDLAVDTPLVSEDGTVVSVPITVFSVTSDQLRGITLLRSGQPIPFASQMLSQFRIGTGVPQIDSMTPIVLRPGETKELLLRGRNFQNTLEVLAEPANGLTFSVSPLPSADGTELRIHVHAQADAPLGARTIRVHTPGGLSTQQAEPANTLTVF